MLKGQALLRLVSQLTADLRCRNFRELEKRGGVEMAAIRHQAAFSVPQKNDPTRRAASYVHQLGLGGQGTLMKGTDWMQVTRKRKKGVT